MHCVDFVENALFKSSDKICWPLLPSLLLDKFSMDKRDSDGFFSRRLVCRRSDSSYNSTDSSLVTVEYQLCFLRLTFFVCTKSADLAYMWYRVAKKLSESVKKDPKWVSVSSHEQTHQRAGADPKKFRRGWLESVRKFCKFFDHVHFVGLAHAHFVRMHTLVNECARMLSQSFSISLNLSIVIYS